MPRLRIIHDNAADRAASLTASSTSGSLAAAYMLSDRKGEVHRSTGTSVTYTLTFSSAETIGAVALPATNLTAAATIRVRLYSDTGATVLLSDTGTVTACPGLNLGTSGNWSTPLNVNAFALGAQAKAVAWFTSNIGSVRAIRIDLSDAGNPAGTIDCARIVAGAWWSPTHNATVGASNVLEDTTVNARSDAGDLISDRGTLHSSIALDLAALTESDRAQVHKILRANGTSRNVFVSVTPGRGDAREQDWMIYGKRQNAAVTYTGLNIHSHRVQIDGW